MSIFSRLFRKGQDAGGDGADGSGSGMKKCSRCGAMWEQGAAFCGECGAPIAAQESTRPPPQGEPQGGSAGRYSFTATEGAQPAPKRTASSASQARPSLSDAALAELFSPNDASSPESSSARVETKPRKPPPPPTPDKGGKARAAAAPNTGKRPAKPPAPPAKPPPPPSARAAKPPAPAPAPPAEDQALSLAPLSDPAPAPPAADPAAAAASPADNNANKRGSKKHSDHGFQKMLDDLDEGFEDIVRESSAPNGVPERLSHPVPDVRDLFQDLAADFARPVRDFMIELKWSDPRKEWIDICLPAVRSLKRSAETMDMNDLVSALTGYQSALEEVAKLGSPVVDAAAKEPLARAYDALAKAMPDGFSLDAERDRREPIIVQSLLLQVPEVRKVTLDKLYAAGLTRLEMYFVSKPEEIAGAAGVDTDVAAQIIAKFKDYRLELQKPPGEGYARERAQLRELTAALSKQNAAYDKAASDWSKEATADKRRLRQEREETLLSINVMLARLGEVDRVRELEKLPFNGKVRELEAFLEEAAQRSRATKELGRDARAASEAGTKGAGAKAPGG